MYSIILVLIPLGYILFLNSKNRNSMSRRKVDCYFSLVIIACISLVIGFIVATLGNEFSGLISVPLFEVSCIAGLIECMLVGFLIVAFKKKERKATQSLNTFWLYLLFPLFEVITLKLIEDTVDEWLNKGIIFSVLSTFFAIIGNLSILHFFVLFPSNESLNKIRDELSEMVKIQKESHSIRANYLAEVKQEGTEFEQILNEIEQAVSANDFNKANSILGDYSNYSGRIVERHFCENKYVDMILTEKSEICKEKGIDFLPNVVIPDLPNIEPAVLCSIFGNLIDNAINACCLFEGEKTFVKISACIKGDYIVTFVDNSADLNSQKRDYSRNHYGLQIISEYARRYSGRFKTHWDKKNKIYKAELTLVAKGGENRSDLY